MHAPLTHTAFVSISLALVTTELSFNLTSLQLPVRGSSASDTRPTSALQSYAYVPELQQMDYATGGNGEEFCMGLGPGFGALVDEEKYVAMSAATAESEKLLRRLQLKEKQREKETLAKRTGDGMTAKQKERERSRRESAVTRRRAEVYISELEKYTRRVPALESENGQLRRLVWHLSMRMEKLMKGEDINSWGVHGEL